MSTALDNQDEYEDAFNPGNYDERCNYQQSRPQNWLSVCIYSNNSGSIMTRFTETSEECT